MNITVIINNFLEIIIIANTAQNATFAPNLLVRKFSVYGQFPHQGLRWNRLCNKLL